MTFHRDMTGASAIHPVAYQQSSDPGAVGAFKLWIDTTTGTSFLDGYVLKIRHADNASWDTLLDLAGGGAPFVPESVFTAKGDLVVATATGAGVRLAIGSANSVLTVNASGTGLAWTAPAAASVTAVNGNSYPATPLAVGEIFYASATNAVAALTGNVSTTNKFLVQVGTGTQAAAPSWAKIAESDLPIPALTSLTSATNITWDVGSARDVLANVTLSVAAVTLTLTNVAAGVAGMLRVTAGVTSPSLTLPSGSLQVGGGGTAAALSTGTVGLVDLLGFVCLATGNYIWSVGKAVA